MRFLLFLLLTFSSLLQAQDISAYAARQIQSAFAAREGNRLDDAIRILEKAARGSAYDKAQVKRYLGVFYWESGAGDKAESALDEAVQSGMLPEGQYRESLRMLADIQLNRQKFNDAITNYRKVIALTTEKEKLAGYWLRIAHGYYAQENWGKVIEATNQYSRYQPQPEIFILTMRLGAFIALNQLSSAIEELKQLREREPKKESWWKQLYSMYLMKEDYSNALTVMQQMERAGFSLDEKTLLTLAHLYHYQGVPELAAKTMGNISELTDRPELIAMQARYWQSSKEWEKAIACWENAVRLSPEYIWEYVSLLMQQKQYQRVIQEVDGMTNPSEKLMLAKIESYYYLGQITEAEVYAHTAFRETGSDVFKPWIELD